MDEGNNNNDVKHGAQKIEVHTDSVCNKEKKMKSVCKCSANNRNLYLGVRSRINVF